MRIKFSKIDQYKQIQERKKRIIIFRNIKQNIFVFISIMLMLLIFVLSAQNANISSHTSNIVYKIITFNGHIFTKVNVRDLAHFFLFGLLGTSIFTQLRYNSYYTLKISYYIVAFVWTTIYAIFDEIHQLFVYGRTCEINDIFIDCLGCIIALIINFIIITILEHNQNKRKEIT